MSEKAAKQSTGVVRIDAFTGLCDVDSAADGALVSAVNVTTRRWPRLASGRGGAALDNVFSSLTALGSWDRLVAVDGTELIYDGRPVAAVSEGEKQFAVIGTKLVVWPDKLCLDMTTGTCRRLDARAEADGGVTLTSSSITLHPGAVGSGRMHKYAGHYWMRLDASPPLWDGQWSDTGTVRNLIGGVGAAGHQGGITAGWKSRVLGDYLYFIPVKTEAGEYLPDVVRYIGKADGEYSPDALPEESAFAQPNGDGVYGIVTAIRSNTLDLTITPGNYRISGGIEFDYVLIDAAGSALLSDSFRAGDFVDISGSALHANDVTRKKITAVSGDTLTLSSGTFTVPRCWYDVAEDEEDSDGFQLHFGGSWYRIMDLSSLMAGDQLMLIDSSTVKLWRDGQTSVYSADQQASQWSGRTVLECREYGPDPGHMVIYRPLPDMDYICHSGGRLWGVSNTVGQTVIGRSGEPERTVNRMIFASVADDPSNFWDTGRGGDSAWRQPVASRGDFTGICAYSGSVLCWKERELIRVSGASSGWFSAGSMNVPGVLPGCHKSLVNVDEVMYYRSDAGISAFSGTTPKLVSGALFGGDRGPAVAGGDGRYYHVCLNNDFGARQIFVYDTLRRAWSAGEIADAADFTYMDGRLYAAAGNRIRLLSSGRMRRYTVGPDGLTEGAYRVADDGRVCEFDLTFPLSEGDYIEWGDLVWGAVRIMSAVREYAYAPWHGAEGDADLVPDAIVPVAFGAAPWSARLAPMDERSHMPRVYSALVLEWTGAPGCTLMVRAAFDCGEPVTVHDGSYPDGYSGVLRIPLPPNSAQRLDAELSGTGETVIRAVTRIFRRPSAGEGE